MKERLICVEWDDATYNSGIYDKDILKRYEQLKTKTVGQVIKSDRKKIIIGTDSWEGEDGRSEYRHITTIPKKMIRRIIKLKEETKEERGCQ